MYVIAQAYFNKGKNADKIGILLLKILDTNPKNTIIYSYIPIVYLICISKQYKNNINTQRINYLFGRIKSKIDDSKEASNQADSYESNILCVLYLMKQKFSNQHFVIANDIIKDSKFINKNKLAMFENFLRIEKETILKIVSTCLNENRSYTVFKYSLDMQKCFEDYIAKNTEINLKTPGYTVLEKESPVVTAPLTKETSVEIADKSLKNNENVEGILENSNKTKTIKTDDTAIVNKKSNGQTL